MSEWFYETMIGGISQGFEVSKVLYKGTSKFQDMMVIENPSVGRILVLDGVVQTTERDEFVYHEMISHVGMFSAENPKNVLIVGGGDGGALREVLRHDVDRVVHVDIDEQVLEVCRAHMPSLNAGAFDDPRRELHIGDGAKYVAEAAERFDVIIVDSTDPIPHGPSNPLYSKEFYGGCARCLKPGGVLISQHYAPFMQYGDPGASLANLATHFDDVTYYLAAVPMYQGGDMAFGWAAQDPAIRDTPLEILEDRYARAGIKTRFYSPEVHRRAFVLPPYIREMVEAGLARAT